MIEVKERDEQLDIQWSVVDHESFVSQLGALIDLYVYKNLKEEQGTGSIREAEILAYRGLLCGQILQEPCDVLQSIQESQ